MPVIRRYWYRRLGTSQHIQYDLKPIQHFTHKIVSVALGQDHTLALTESGEVLSWGLNRFSQLGYVVESASTASVRLEEPIQLHPRKVYGPLKKEVVRGVAASKCASACWTDRGMFTWGTNNGQLGTNVRFAANCPNSHFQDTIGHFSPCKFFPEKPRK